MKCRYSMRLFFALSLLLTAGSGAAQVAYHNFNSNDGLPSNEVYCSFQDNEGFLWFGTDHGVVKYNGYSFKTYTTDDGLTDNTILDIKADDQHQIWFLTLSGGICYFDGKKFKPHPNNDIIKNLFSSGLPTSWEVLNKNELWAGFVNRGIAKIQNGNITFWGTVNPVPVANDSVSIYVLPIKNGKYIYTSIMHEKMISVHDKEAKPMKTFRVSFDYSGTNFNLLLLPNGQIITSKEQFFALVDSNMRVRQFSKPRSCAILKLVATSNQNIWMLQKNNSSYLVKLLADSVATIDSLVFVNNASSLINDIQGNVWVTSLDGGGYMIPNQKVRIYLNRGLTVSSKISFINSDQKKLYAGLPAARYLSIGRRFESSINVAKSSAENATATPDITFRLNGDLQFSLDTTFIWDNGINSFHTKVLQISEHNFLIGASNGFSIVTNNKKLIYSSAVHGFNKRVTEICQISPSQYLIGTLTGLYYFKTSPDFSINDEPLLKNLRITKAKCLNKHMFGVSTRGRGIFVNYLNKYYEISEKNGLISNLAEDLYFENDTTLWEASFKGISKIYFKLTSDSLYTRIKNYTREDGLCSNQVNGIIGFNGYIWLATNEGLCYFKPGDLPEDTMLLPLYFSNISVNGVKWPADSLSLSHNQNNISIEFNALYYKAIEGIRYKIKLNGIGPWKFTDQNFIQYFNLSPGQYKFEVAAEDKYGKYRSAIHTINFYIKPQFTDTPVFRGLLAFIIFLIIIIIASAIFSYQKLKSTNIIKLLQFEFKALSYQINPHFIFNVLNSIQYYILKKDTNNAIHLLGSFSLLIRRIVNNSRQQYISVVEEIECLREYMDLEKMRLDNSFDYYINIDSSIDVEEKNILPMVIQPLVENSIWHGIVPSLNHGVITIDFKKEHGAVICTVEDNGVGINKSVTKEKNQNNLSLAMKNVTERLKIISELNNSTWAINIQDKSPVASGTIVTINFPALKK